MKSFAEHFCLKDGFDNLVPDGSTPFSSTVVSQILKAVATTVKNASLTRRAPRFVLAGDYGSGKTHALYYIAHVITSKRLPLRPLYIACPDLSKASPFNVLFQRLLSQIEFKAFQPLLVAHIKSNPRWLKRTSSVDIKCAFTHIASAKHTGDLAYHFLSGHKLKRNEQAALGVKKQQLSNGADFASVVKIISQVICSEAKQHLVYLIDQWDTVGAITDRRALQQWHDCLHAILNIKTVGLVFALSNQSLTELPPLLLDEQIVKQIGRKNYLLLKHYDAKEIETFYISLFRALIDPRKRKHLEAKAGLKQTSGYSARTYPFTKRALSGFCRHLASDYGNAKPSNALTQLHTTALAAMQRGQHIVDQNLLEAINSYA